VPSGDLSSATTYCWQVRYENSDGLWSAYSAAASFTTVVPHLAFAAQPTAATAGTAISPSLVVDVEDANGKLLTSDNSNVTLCIQSGSAAAAMSGTVTVAAVNGVATFTNVILTTAGACQLEATDGSAAVAKTASFNVAPGAAAQLAFATQPPAGTAGTALSSVVNVAVEDAYGNLVTSNSGSVTLAIQTGSAGSTLGGTTSVHAQNGVATFSHVVLDTAGAYKFSASQGVLAAATSAGFTVAAAAAAKLAFITQPTAVTAGAAISPAVTVAVEDAYGNIETTSSAMVTLAIQRGPVGGVPGGTLAVHAQDGVAAFSNVVLDTAGAYKLIASRGILAPATSSKFIVSPGAPAKLAIVTQPSATTRGVAIHPAIVVDVEDPFGNLVTTDTSDITLSIQSGPADAILGGIHMVAANDGAATFADVLLHRAGSYRLKATDGSLPTTRSVFFAVA
jgi:hypothetical protein